MQNKNKLQKAVSNQACTPTLKGPYVVHYLQFTSDVRACTLRRVARTAHKRDRAGQRRDPCKEGTRRPYRSRQPRMGVERERESAAATWVGSA